MANYAIVKSGGRQILLEKGKEYQVDLLSLEPEAKYSFDNVLLLRDGEQVEVGQPTLEEVRVDSTVVRHEKGKKQIVFKFRRRKGSQTKKGHRQQYTRIRVDGIFKNDKEL